MKKILGIFIVILFLSGCGGYSLSSAFIDQEYSDGGVIWNHFMSGTGHAGMTSLANSSCTARGFASANLSSPQKQGEFKTYRFTCVSKSEQAETKRVELASMVDKAKDTCKSLGFNEGTDKFSDCSLKLYTQSVELAAEKNQKIVVQGQSSGSNVMTIYDPVRDSNAAIKRGQGLINGTCTLAELLSALPKPHIT